MKAYVSFFVIGLCWGQDLSSKGRKFNDLATEDPFFNFEDPDVLQVVEYDPENDRTTKAPQTGDLFEEDDFFGFDDNFGT